MASKPFPSPALLAICAAVAALALLSAAEAGVGFHHDAAAAGHLGLGGSRCSGSIAECLGAEEEFEMDSESNRRILATSNYISYGALSRNSVPCSRRGASYYNCQPGAQSNPYSRGCSTITRCRS